MDSIDRKISPSDCRWHYGRCAYRDDDPTRCPFCHLSWKVVQRDGVHHCERPQAWPDKRDVRQSIARQMREAVEQGHDPLAVLETVDHAGVPVEQVDRTGHRYGRLTVVEWVEGQWWRCRCTCGGEKVVDAQHLQQGNTRSCGCLRRAKDLTGKRYGRLTVVERVEDYMSPAAQPHIQWRCLCSCGIETIATTSALTQGKTRSCGCLVRETAVRIGAARLIDLTGKRYGELTVIKRGEDYVNRKGKKKPRWRCRCSCGTQVIVQSSNLHSGRTISCGCLNRSSALPPKEIVGYAGAHYRLARALGKASVHQCVDCDQQAAQHSYVGGCPKELIGTTGTSKGLSYCLHAEHYLPRCRTCHKKHDLAYSKA